MRVEPFDKTYIINYASSPILGYDFITPQD
jgi:hypothetical protein